MARYFSPISIDDFKQQILLSLKKNEDFLYLTKSNPINSWEDLCERDVKHKYLRIFPTLTKIVSKDIKVEFDTENIEMSLSQYSNILGFHTLSQGFTFMGIYAGGDWEIPVFFILYWDGKNVRGYVPKNGNAWNTKTNQAYGNNSAGKKSDAIDIKQRYPYMKNSDMTDDCDCVDFFIDLSFNEDDIIKDIRDRIKLK
jgi:hypothetical protein